MACHMITEYIMNDQFYFIEIDFNQIKNSPDILILPPVGFLDIIALQKNAKLIVTDSGGLQKEAFFFKKPCLILRDQTEWIEIV